MLKCSFISILLGIVVVLNAQEIRKVDSDVLFTCYRQGRSGDCVSVGFTKAVIGVFGVNGVFKERNIDDTHTEVTLKNGKKYILTTAEFLMADTAMHIKPGPNADAEIMGYATKCFAVMAKVKQDIDNIGTFEEAIYKLQHGAHGRKHAQSARFVGRGGDHAAADIFAQTAVLTATVG